MIELKDVSKTFKQGDEEIRALKHASLRVEAGQMVAVVGPSGSGKSTMLTILGGLQTPTEGQVWLNGIELSTMSEKERARERFKNLGFILQSSSLVPYLTVEDQTTLHDKVLGEKPDFARRDELFKELGVDHLYGKYPEELSGGERQRVAIATALYHDPAVVLADEPTAALDTERAFATVKLLKKLTHEKQKATVVVTHDRRLLDDFDVVVEIRDGELSIL